MNQPDIDFFDAYKHLDKLCGEVFHCSNGVSEYISQMEKTPSGRFRVPLWENDYRSLKHIRWVRNQIAHDSSGCTISTIDDLYFTEEFYNRVMNRDDPFARLRMLEKPKPKPKPKPAVKTDYVKNTQTNNVYRREASYAVPKKKYRFGKVLGVICAAAILLLLFRLFMR